MNEFQDAFISYGRADSKAFATKLHTRLVEAGLDIWFDQNDIPLGVDFQNQIDDGLEKSHNFLFIIAPHSINSIYCGKEINLAIQCNKRIIPLLHVEQITRDTWQERNPHGTDEDWDVYQEKGLHSSFPNMHPVIGKINWVYFREGIDDFEQSFQGLLDVMDRHKGYVENHTTFLANALEWSRNKRLSRYLLTGRNRQIAEDWLRVRFQNEQPPCEPTDLHCEFICESIKNANNLMTKVFLCYDGSDRAVMEKVRRSLRREGFTIWTDDTDIQTGDDPQTETKRGIEGADNVVYLLTQRSLDSGDCQRELDHAFDCHKRIIPLQLEAIENLSGSSRRGRRGLDSIYGKLGEETASPLPTRLRSLQFLDFIHHEDDGQYRTSLDRLIAAIKENETYYELHKLFLSRTIKWEDQDRNTSILLRGYLRDKAESWLRGATTEAEHPPTKGQRAFIAASLEHPPESSLDVFLSYPMEESDFARKLNEALQFQGKTTWFDQETVESRLDAPSQVLDGIETCDNILVMVSPYVSDMKDCEAEIRHALDLSKRILVVLPYGLPDDYRLPEQLTDLPQVDFSDDGGSFSVNFNELMRQLEIDRDYVHSHTQWLQRAIEWQSKSRSPDLLLRGNELAIATAWLNDAEETKKKPLPTDLQKLLIAESQQAADEAAAEEKRKQEELLQLQEDRAQEAEARLAAEQQAAKRQQIFLQVVSLGLFGALGLSGLTLNLYRQSLISRVHSTALSSAALFSDNRQLDSLVQAIHAKRLANRLNLKNEDSNLYQQVNESLQRVVYGVQEINRLEGRHTDWVESVSFSPDGQMIATASADATVCIWLRNGQPIFELKHDDGVTQALFTRDGDRLITSSEDGTIHLWDIGELASEDARDENLKQVRPLLDTFTAHESAIIDLALNTRGDRLASISEDQTIKLWTVDGELQQTIKTDGATPTGLAFFPNQAAIAASYDDGTVRIWDVDGTLTKQIDLSERGGANSVAISRGGDTLAVGSDNGDLTLWETDGTLIFTLQGHGSSIETVEFIDDRTLLSAGRDNSVKLWSTSGVLREIFSGHQDWIWDLAVDPNTGAIASASADGSIRIWQQNQIFNKITAHNGQEIWDVALNATSSLFATASSDTTIHLWNREGRFQGAFEGHTDGVDNIAFSENGQLMVSASWDERVIIWNVETREIQAILDDHDDWVVDVDLSPDDTKVASASEDGTVKLWSIDGELLDTLEEHNGPISSIDYPPTEPLLIVGSGNRIYFWNTDTNELMKSIEAHEAPVLDLNFNSSGDRIVSSSRDTTVKLWTSEGEALNTLEGHSDWVWSVDFSPSGDYIVSGSSDQTVKLWRTADGLLLTNLSGHRAAVEDVDFGSDDGLVLSGSWDGDVILWDINQIIELNELEYACGLIEDYLTVNPFLLEDDRNVCRNLSDDDDVPWYEETLRPPEDAAPNNAPDDAPASDNETDADTTLEPLRDGSSSSNLRQAGDRSFWARLESWLPWNL
jgi:WD40 repeat protein